MSASKPGIPERHNLNLMPAVPQLQRWLRKIAADYRLFIPAEKGGNRIFEELAPDDEPVLGLPQERTVIPAKKVFLPPSEPLFSFNGNEIDAAPTAESTVIFGLHVCELSADRLLSANMAYDRPDFPYVTRRSRGLTIGVTCIRTSGCFCEKTGHNRITAGDYDLFLHLDGAEMPRLAVCSDAGRGLAADAPFPVEDPGGDVVAPAAQFPQRWPLESLPEKIHESFGAVMWDELAARCLGCGNCTIVCPLCYCFYTRDETGLDPAGGSRLRLWDSCQLLAFARVAGGHNFREARSERIWYRFSHKFMRTQEIFGAPGCSGCGACFHFCPVGIDPRQVIAGVLDVTAHA